MLPKLRFREFKEQWELTLLGDVTSKIGSGSTPKGGSEVYQSTGIPFIRSQNVNDNQLKLNDLAYISHEIDEKMKGSRVEPNDILLNITGASIGRSCVVPQDFSKGNVNQHVCIIRLARGVPKFYQTYLSSQKGQNLINSSQSGSGREGLNFENIRNFKIYACSKAEQLKIADFLSSVDRKINLLNKQYELLGQYKKGIIQKIFNQKLRFKNENQKDFPAWNLVRLGDYLIKHNEKSTENNQYPVLTSSRGGIYFQRDYFNGEDVASKNNIGYNVVPNGYFTYRHMSDDLVFKFNINTICSKGIVSTLYPVFTTSLNKFFLQLKLNEGKEFRDYAIQQKQGGSRTYMYYSKLESLKLMIPTMDEQTKIANFISAFDEKIVAKKIEMDSLKIWKQGLLQQMFI